MRVPETLRTHSGREGGWTRLEVLGTCSIPPQTIISVLCGHRLMAAIPPRLPAGWLGCAHGYKEMAWPQLLACDDVPRDTQKQLSSISGREVECTVHRWCDKARDATLSHQDYIPHQQHHLKQILAC